MHSKDCSLYIKAAASQDQSEVPVCCFPPAGKLKGVSPEAITGFTQEEKKQSQPCLGSENYAGEANI